jgi:TfoX/Sxy family transcriptional regulator of competence genes
MGAVSIADLEEILNSVAAELPLVTGKKMFGCHALWANGNVFALVWKHGRIGLKLPDESSFAGLMKLPGAEPWKAGPMTMAHWVLVPAAFHVKTSELKKWALKAHEQCSALEAKTKKKAKPKSNSRTAQATPSKKKAAPKENIEKKSATNKNSTKSKLKGK